ncbi:MAG: tRNA (cytidine(56)-2'-O)-methyltransferase [Candidatus Diapherotrites archaeon]|nr:tRNA (cytidine(56)-2'-O)-methyltransferase [Candidatus Diapherotrites archaeon]
MAVTVLRLGHRPERDKRVSTHAALVARAFGADRIVYTGVRDEKMEKSVCAVSENWGGSFSIAYERSWKKVVRDFDGCVVHLTMYGLPVDDVVKNISGDVLVVVGGEKVPGDVYEAADFNVSVSSQPHSEIAALAVFLDRFFRGSELSKDFNGRLRIVPQPRGKKVITE